MDRTIWIAPLVGVAALGIGMGVYFYDAVAADPGANPPAALALKEPAPAVPVKQTAGQLQLPVSQVVLFSSGVGYYQREGEVEGNARIDLIFPQENINDLLKSMVLQDLGGGKVSTVSYDSRDPVEKTLKSYAINLNNNPSLSQILMQARGEKVEVLMQQTNVTQPGTLTGVIVGVEKQKLPMGKEAAVECDMVNLMCAEGLRCIKLMEIQKLRFLNPIIENELKRALDTLALSHDTAKKVVSVNFLGEGKRPVKVGYVTESPIWKTSYRLAIDKDGKPFLQGWAVVENTTDEDWKDVRMALISGRPISFQMNLYDPLYVQRPVVEPELFASLRPITYGGDLDGTVHKGVPREMESLKNLQQQGRSRKDLTREDAKLRNRPASDSIAGGEFNIRDGVESVAEATSLGDYFQYLIEKPVSLSRQKSAMLPIVNTPIEGSKVSIYNEKNLAKHPLLGLKLKNTSGLHLMQGPITVYDGPNYAGDARILDLQPKEERLISYAVDLGVEVEAVRKPTPERMIKVKLHKGILHRTDKVVETITYTAKNRTEQDRALLIEHPFRPEFALKAPEKYAERTRDQYRFELSLPANKSAKTEVVEERDLVQSVQITNFDGEGIRFFLQSPVVSDKVKQALAQALELRSQVAVTQREIAHAQAELKIITDDQGRIRANLEKVPPTSNAYKRYLEKFDEQEPQIEKLQEKIRRLQQQAHEQEKAYEAFLMSLDVE